MITEEDLDIHNQFTRAKAYPLESVITEEDLNEIRNQCTKAKSYLLEDDQDGISKKRAVDCLNHVLTKINEPRKNPTGHLLSNNDKDWQFVDKYYEDHGSLNWEAIFKLGKLNELFGNYSKGTSVKAAFLLSPSFLHRK